MGTGADALMRPMAFPHLDAPWKHIEVEQREGRILRQGLRDLHPRQRQPARCREARGAGTSLDDPIEIADDEPKDARVKIEATRDLLRPLDPDDDRARLSIARLVEMAAEVARIEGVIAGVSVGADVAR